MGVSSSGAGGRQDGRFPAGTVLADRYRVIGLLGRGGMGEVYRADDLRLGQPVALKFLPERLATDSERRERFNHEVRVAREISHASVCRVHDIGEWEGQPFLSMEYVDGENLASLLKRIGRLPAAKASEIARQICAGLAAAHQKGVLHRDLKPDNVMIDGQGRVRLTDFGLAGVAEAIAGDDLRSGTPAYMSPEQLAGKEVTTRSDLYSLGLVLYELFTGQKAFTGKTLADFTRAHLEAPAPSPSAVVADLDPAVETAILRCLDKDPGRRPSSALWVAATLPGGDPLAAALAAGETPSPEMVAAGEGQALSPAWAAAALGMVAVGLLLLPPLTERHSLLGLVPVEKSPPVLEDKARELIRRLARPAPAVDDATGFTVEYEYFPFVAAKDRSPGRWEALSTGAPRVLQFWYRQSPQLLVSTHLWGRVSSQNPPVLVSGMAGLSFDLRGRLTSYYEVTPQVLDAAPQPADPPDWSVLFAEAQFDLSAFRPVAPTWTPPFFTDARAAWEGAYPERPDLPIRVEAAGYRGRPVFFRIIAPWTRAERMEAFRFSRGQRTAITVWTLVTLGLVAASILLARRHLRSGRGDQKGARRLAGYALVVGVVSWALYAHHVHALDEINLAIRGLGANLLVACLIFTLYLAIEPYVRRQWPHALISWTRLLAGRVGDPQVGRDLLIGAAAGCAMALLVRLSDEVPAWLHLPGGAPRGENLDTLLGLPVALREIADGQLSALALGMGFTLLLMLLRSGLRRDWLAVTAAVSVMAIQPALTSDATPWVALAVSVLVWLIPATVIAHFGLLSGVTVVYVLILLVDMPLMTDLRSWTGSATVVSLLAVAGLAAYGWRTSQGSRRRWDETLT